MSSNDITLQAAARLEAALERLAASLEARFAATQGTAPSDDMVPRAEVERLAARLDDALGRLRAILGEDAGTDS